MAFWFFRGVRRGIVTTRYPDVIDAWTQTLPTPPAFYSELLSTRLADHLVGICPAGALTRADRELVVDLGACSACGRCVEEGAGAVRPSGVFELSSTRRDRLLKRVPIRGDAS
ncbi:MAG TPA: hypothetical protein VMB51_04455 [Solirubrobacteraceae bacterium]|nr:hypothetical protein [Solirubrobacteraceae bacterium]